MVEKHKYTNEFKGDAKDEKRKRIEIEKKNSYC